MSLCADLARTRVRTGISRQLLSSGPIYHHRETTQDALPALLVLLASRFFEEPVKLLEDLVLCLGDEEDPRKFSTPKTCDGTGRYMQIQRGTRIGP